MRPEFETDRSSQFTIHGAPTHEQLHFHARNSLHSLMVYESFPYIVEPLAPDLSAQNCVVIS
jgi:hypothetical protein